LWRAVARLTTSDDFTFASSIAYYALVSLLPLLLFSFSILAGVTANGADRAAVVNFALRYFPGQIDLVRTQLDLLEGSGTELSVAGTILTIWVSLGLFRAITSAVNHAWDVDERPSFFKHQVTSFLLLVGASLTLLTVLLIVGIIGVIGTRYDALLRALPWVGTITGFAFRYAATLLLIVILGLVFYLVPNAPVQFRDVWVGAILTGVLWRVALGGFSWYLRAFSALTVQGSIGAVVAFLFWIYISAVIFIFGVEFTAAYARLKRARV